LKTHVSNFMYHFIYLCHNKGWAQVRSFGECLERGKFVQWEVVSTSPTPKLGYHSILAARDSLFNIFEATHDIGGRSSPQYEDATLPYSFITGSFFFF
jgi:hypothetical protein